MRSNPDNAPAKKEAYQDRLKIMSDEGLFTETKERLWLSAYASNNPRSCYHWQCDYTYDEWTRREKTDQYSKAHAEVVSEVGA